MPEYAKTGCPYGFVWEDLQDAERLKWPTRFLPLSEEGVHTMPFKDPGT